MTYRQTFPPLKALSLGVKQTFWVTGQIYAGLWGFVTDPVRLHTTVRARSQVAQVARQQARVCPAARDVRVLHQSRAHGHEPLADSDPGRGTHPLRVHRGGAAAPLSLKTQLFFQRIGLFVLMGLVVFAFTTT
jgi:hypothetical protein